MEDTYTELYEKLSRLQWLLQRHHMMNHAEHGPFADTTRGQGRVLAMLKIQPEISTKDLSYLLGIKVASLNELLGKLEKGGYIERKPAEADKRVMMIHLTEKGKSEQQADTDYSGIFDCLSTEELATFGDSLDRVIDALEAKVGSGEDEDERASWMQSARSRMGDDMFEHMMSAHGGQRRGPHGREGFFGGFGHGGRGPAPHDMPGAERFAPGYDGPMPDGRSPHPHGGRPGPDAPPPPPRGPHEPDDEK